MYILFLLLLFYIWLWDKKTCNSKSIQFSTRFKNTLNLLVTMYLFWPFPLFSIEFYCGNSEEQKFKQSTTTCLSMADDHPIERRDEVIEVVSAAAKSGFCIFPNKLSINSPRCLQSNDLNLNYHLGNTCNSKAELRGEKENLSVDRSLQIYSARINLTRTVKGLFTFNWFSRYIWYKFIPNFKTFVSGIFSENHLVIFWQIVVYGS